MKLAVAWRLIARNPLEHIEMPSEAPPPFHVYAPAEQAALLTAAAPGEGDKNARWKGRSEGSLYVPIALDLATGLRRGELLGLRVGDVDLKRNRIHVRQALRKDEHGALQMGPCKTGRSLRSVVVPESSWPWSLHTSAPSRAHRCLAPEPQRSRSRSTASRRRGTRCGPERRPHAREGR